MNNVGLYVEIHLAEQQLALQILAFKSRLSRNDPRLPHAIERDTPRIHDSMLFAKASFLQLRHIILSIEVGLRQEEVLKARRRDVRIGNARPQTMPRFYTFPFLEVLVDVGAYFGRLFGRRRAFESKVLAQQRPPALPSLPVLLRRDVERLAVPTRLWMQRKVDRLSGDHVASSEIALGRPALHSCWEGDFGAFALDFGVEGEEDAEGSGEGVVVVIGNESDDDVWAGLAPCPAFVV